MACLLAVCLSAIGCKDKEERPEAGLGGEVIPVTTLVLTLADETLEVRATGLLHTEKEVRNAFKIGGVISKITVEEGETFKKGQLLAALEPTEINTGLNQAKLAMEKAERSYNRIQNLYVDSVATLEQLQDSKTALDIAMEQYDAVAFNRSHAAIYAGSDGFVVKKLANVGEVIGEGTPVLATAREGQDGWVLKAGVSDRQWALIPEKAPATVRLEAFPDREFKGRVLRKSLAADQASGSFQIEVKIEDLDAGQAIGMFGTATIRTGTKDYVFVPHEAVVEADGRRAFVFTPEDGNKVKKLPIEIEAFDAERIKVTSGLEGVQELILTNSAFLNENSTIIIKNASGENN